jgi:hypothetical protein
MSVDFTTVTSLTSQIKALQDQAAQATDPTVKAILNSQANVAASQLTADLQHMQAQSDASSNLLSTMGLFATLTSVVGGAAPSIIALLKP